MNHSIRKVGAFNVFAAIISVLGVALVMARQITYGVNISPDSITFISAALNMLAGEGFSSIWGDPVTWWPPLYPLLLAAASMGIWDPLDVAGPVNAIIFGLTIFVVGRYLRQRLTFNFLAIWTCLVVALSIPLSETASWAHSDTLFILLVTLTLVWIDKYLTVGRLSFLVWAAVFSALAWLTRYIGAVVPLLVVLLLLFQSAPTPMERARRIAVFSLIATLPMVLWMVRNYLLTGIIGTGSKRTVDFTLPMSLRESFEHVWGGWLYFDLSIGLGPSFEYLPVASAILLLVVLLAASTGWIFSRHLHSRHVTILTGAHYVFGGFAVVYFVLLITAAILGHMHHGIYARYLTPLYIPLLVVAVVAFDKLLFRPLAAVLMTVLSIWLIGQIPPNIDQIVRANAGELADFNGPRWADSETLRYIEDNPINGLYYTTVRIVWLRTGGTGTYKRLPKSRPSSRIVDERYFASGTGQEQFRRWLADVPDGAYVIWFHNLHPSIYDYNAADMRGATELETVAEFADGVIFRINKIDAPRLKPHLSAYTSIIAGDFGLPVASSTFDIYLDGTTLIYIKVPCIGEDLAAKFFLHVVPSDSAGSRQHGSNFNNLDFYFSQYGAIWDGKCLGIVTLPDYKIARIHTGQFVRDSEWKSRKLWGADLPIPILPVYNSIIAGDFGSPVVPAARSPFDIRFDGITLTYLDEICDDEDVAARFFLHIVPSDDADLGADRIEYGMNNLDFNFEQYGAIWDGRCLAVVTLPDYDIARIRTGQYISSEGRLWEADFIPAKR